MTAGALPDPLAPADGLPAEAVPANDPYEDLVARARALAEEKRARGDVPEGTNESLDRLFLEVAPPGARAESEGIAGLVEMLSRYMLDADVPVDSARPRVGPLIGVAKRLLRPLASWQLRYLVDQLNAYHAAQMEVLRALVREAEKRR